MFCIAIVLIPTIPFIGVRISWLIRERNSLFAKLAASARFRLPCITVAFIRAPIASSNAVNSTDRTNITININCKGFAYIKSVRENSFTPIDSRFRLRITVLSDSERLLIALLSTVNKSGSTGVGNAKLIALWSLTNVTGARLVKW